MRTTLNPLRSPIAQGPLAAAQRLRTRPKVRGRPDHKPDHGSSTAAVAGS
jgi:hypothetical protein